MLNRAVQTRATAVPGAILLMNCGIVTASELVQECQQLAVGTVSTRSSVDGCGPGEDLLSECEIGVEIDLCGVHRLVTKPQCNGHLLDACMQQVHGRSMPQAMERDPLLAYRGASQRRLLQVFAK